MAKKEVKKISISGEYQKKGLLHQVKRIWKAFNIPDYEKGSYGKATGKRFKNQMFSGAPGYTKVTKIKHKSRK